MKKLSNEVLDLLCRMPVIEMLKVLTDFFDDENDVENIINQLILYKKKGDKKE